MDFKLALHFDDDKGQLLGEFRVAASARDPAPRFEKFQARAIAEPAGQQEIPRFFEGYCLRNHFRSLE